MDETQIRVLLIEDNPTDAKLVQEELVKRGNGHFQLDCVDRLSTALDRLDTGEVDLVLSDLKLPDSEGSETFDRIRSHAPLLPVIILAGNYEDQEMAMELVKKGAQDYIVKSQMDGRLLPRILRYAVERKRQELMKDEFISLVSHELRTPLTIMREGISQVIEGICGDVNEDQKEVLSIAVKSVDRLARIINDLLDISKLEAGKLKLDKDLVDLNELGSEMADAFKLKAKTKRIGIRIYFSSKNIEAYVDRDKITQVFTNLLNNALKFTDTGTITIAVKNAGKEIECSVADTGKGISKEDVGKVFSKFQQFGRSSGTGTDKGTGLGLAISRGIIELHHGKIWIESTLGKGTRFVFTLPRYSGQEVFLQYVTHSMNESERHGTPLSVMVFGITNYHELQDQNDLGAQMVRRLQKVVREKLRRKADVAVMDSRAVLVLLPETAKGDALTVAQRIQNAFDDCLTQEGKKELVRMSWDVASFPDDGKTTDAILEKVGLPKESALRKVLLVIEDEPDQAQLIQSRLRANGFEVVLARSGEEGINKAAAEPPELILLDLMLPEMDGFEVCKRMKGDPRTRHIPIVLLTGYDVENFNEKCKQVGADAWVKRPYQSAVLMSLIQRFT